MKWSIPMGRVWGIPIRMHLTFVLLLAWIAWLGWSVDGLRSSLWALALIISLFACVVLHELGHSLVAIRFGARVRSVTLLPIGGVASMQSIPEKPVQELLVSLAGPFQSSSRPYCRAPAAHPACTDTQNRCDTAFGITATLRLPFVRGTSRTVNAHVTSRGPRRHRGARTTRSRRAL